MIAFDANILFYVFDWREAAKQRLAAELLRNAETAEIGTIPLQALGEFAHSTVRRTLLSRSEAYAAVSGWLSLFPVSAADAEAMSIALEWWKAERFSYWDALLIATVMRSKATALASEDLQDGAIIGGVEIINPFADDAPGRFAAHGLAL